MILQMSAVAAFLLVALACARSAAQAPCDRDRALQLWDEAKQARDSKDLKAALSLTIQAAQLCPYGGFDRRIAKLYVMMGDYVSALIVYDKVIARGGGVSDQPAEDVAAEIEKAKKEKSELLERMPTAKISVSGRDPNDVIVRIDGEAFDDWDTSASTLLAPGPHEFSAEAISDGAKRTQTVNLPDGKKLYPVSLDLPRPEPSIWPNVFLIGGAATGVASTVALAMWADNDDETAGYACIAGYGLTAALVSVGFLIRDPEAGAQPHAILRIHPNGVALEGSF